jgi:DNA-binding NarL/FixJ family response regulator
MESPAVTVRVLICEKTPVVRAGLCTLIGGEPDIEVVKATDSGLHAIMLACSLRPDVVITGLCLRSINGVELTQRLLAEQLEPAARVLVFCTDTSDDTVTKVLHAGAAGLLTHDATGNDLLAAIHAVAAGQAMLAPQVTQRLVSWFRRTYPQLDDLLHPVVAALTPRERQVLMMIGRGMQPDDIAEALTIGVATVRTHIYRLRCKLDLKDRAQLASFAHRAGLMQPA